jgi:hypothetical protein
MATSNDQHNEYKITLKVSHPDALPEPVFEALEALARAIDEDRSDEVEGFRSQPGLSLGSSRGPTAIKNDPEGFCIGYSGDFGDKQGSGSCWINW